MATGLAPLPFPLLVGVFGLASCSLEVLVEELVSSVVVLVPSPSSLLTSGALSLRKSSMVVSTSLESCSSLRTLSSAWRFSVRFESF